jgi:hypothetical protein
MDLMVLGSKVRYWEYFPLKAGATRRQPGNEGSYAEEGPDEM